MANPNQNPAPKEPQKADCPSASCWASLGVSDRNKLIGNLIGGRVIRRPYMARDGQYLWACPIHADEVPERSAWLAEQQATEASWKRFRKDFDARITAEDRGKITIEIEEDHLRYSDTPAGGWMVIEAMRPRVQQIFVLSCDDGEWEVMAIPLDERPEDITCKAKTMQEAACELALLILPNAEVCQPEGAKKL
jgi:hypothetical protein